MTPIDYCRARLGGPGTSLYYSLWHLPAARRDALTALHALAAEIAAVPHECREPQLAQAKLAWWRNEIRQAARRRATHPATVALGTWTADDARAPAALLDLVEAAEDDLAPPHIGDFDALRDHARRRLGTVAELAAALCGARSAAALAGARELGGLHGVAQRLTGAGADLRRGRVYLPRAELARFGVREGALAAAAEDDAWQAFMLDQIERLARHYEDALAGVPPSAVETLLPELIMAALQRALLAEVRAAGGRVLSQRIALTPLRQLWIAWRTRRRALRSKPAAGPG